MDRIGALTAAFAPRRDPEKAVAMAAYMKDRFPFLGIPSPERRVAQREALGDWRMPTGEELASFARACWAEDEREYQYAGCDTLVRHVERLGPDVLELCEELITTKPWWDTTDALASRVVAAHADRPTLERDRKSVV